VKTEKKRGRGGNSSHFIDKSKEEKKPENDSIFIVNCCSVLLKKEKTKE